MRAFGGDCNKELSSVLEQLRRQRLGRAPTFAFVDPDGLEVRWETLKALAEHKGTYKYKVDCGCCSRPLV